MKKLMMSGMTLLPLLIAACGPYGPMRRWGGEDGYFCSFGYGRGGMFMGIVVFILLAVVLYFIVKAIREKNVGGTAKETPLDILKKRYAAGEISKEEFDRIKSDL